MSDRAYMAITVYACPEDKRDVMLDTILDAFGQTREENERLTLGTDYNVEEIVLGAEEELFTAIAENVSSDLNGLTFDIQQEPKYEFDGARIIAVAELAAAAGFSCNSNGEPIVVWESVKDHIGDAEAMARAFYRPWVEAIDAAREAHRETRAAG